MASEGFVASRMRDVRAALTTLPTWPAWRLCLIVYAAFLACALPIGLLTGVVRFSPAPFPAATAVGIALAALVHPAFVEETIFRALLVPRWIRELPAGRALLIAGFALAAYVASHPVNAILFRPAALGIFTNPAYLFIAALLGVACTVVYAVSGSIWPAVLLHWITAVVWILLLGGQSLVTATAP
jgi:predicted Abi (CAAX) family protease